jgi:hypothetical protein
MFHTSPSHLKENKVKAVSMKKAGLIALPASQGRRKSA